MPRWSSAANGGAATIFLLHATKVTSAGIASIMACRGRRGPVKTITAEGRKKGRSDVRVRAIRLASLRSREKSYRHGGKVVSSDAGAVGRRRLFATPASTSSVGHVSPSVEVSDVGRSRGSERGRLLLVAGGISIFTT